MQRLSSAWLLVAATLCCALAVAGLANSYRVDDHARAAQREAIARGVVTHASVLGSLTNKQRRVRVRLVVDGAERQTSVFPDERHYTAGTAVDAAYLPGRPERVFVVGSRPWTWWAAMRTLFVVVALVTGALLLGCLAVRARGPKLLGPLVVAGLAIGIATSAPAASVRPSVGVRSSTYGRILFDGRGFVLYAFTKDPRGRSVCTGACAAAWPPYVVYSKPAAARGASPRLLGTTRRADGRLQATYAGRPLYYYVGDRRAGQILCQNVVEYGGTWLVLRADGALVR